MTEKKISKHILYVSAFFIPFTLLLLYYISFNVYPFGERSILMSDMNTQYVYFMAVFRKILLGKENFIYSFHMGLGGNMLSLIAYYLASPFNLILVLFPESMIQEAMAVIILLKVGCMGLSSAYFFRQERKSSNITTLVFSTSYAFMSYVIIFNMHIMWLDGLIFLPLIAHEVGKLKEKNRNPRLITYIALCLLTNFYIAYMICIFTPIWLGYKMVSTIEQCRFVDVMKRIGVLLYHGILGAALSTFLLVPTIISLLYGNGTTLNDNNIHYTLFDIIRALYFGVYDTIRPGGIPLLYTGIITIILVGFYFFSPKIQHVEKIYSVGVLLFFYTSVKVKFLYLAWHGFDAPTWFETRFSFIVAFFLLNLAYQAVNKLEKTKRTVFITVGEALFFTIGIIVNRLEFTMLQAILNAGFFIIYNIFLWLYLERNMKFKKIILLVICVELFASACMSKQGMQLQAPYHYREDFNYEMGKGKTVVDDLKKQDPQVYRLEKYFDFHDNDALSQSYMGLSMFTSIYYPDVNRAFARLGIDATARQSSYVGTTVFTDSLFGIKYVLSHSKQDSLNRDYSVIGDTYVYKNPYAYDLFTVVNKSVLDINPEKYMNPFTLQNRLIQKIYNTQETVFTLVDYTATLHNVHEYINNEAKIGYEKINQDEDAYVEYTIYKNDAQIIYAFIRAYSGKATIKVNHETVSEFLGSLNRISNVDGVLANDKKITIQLQLDGPKLTIQPRQFYAFNTRLFDSLSKNLDSHIEYTKFSNTHIKFKTTVTSDNQVMISSVPYDRGWTVKVNHKEVKPQEVIGGFMGIPVSEGDNEIELTFRPVGLSIGLMISVATAIFLLFFTYGHTRKKR